LLRHEFGVAARREGVHHEIVGTGVDDFQRLRADRSGRTEQTEALLEIGPFEALGDRFLERRFRIDRRRRVDPAFAGALGAGSEFAGGAAITGGGAVELSRCTTSGRMLGVRRRNKGGHRSDCA